jgi:2'-5' RNA ligase
MDSFGIATGSGDALESRNEEELLPAEASGSKRRDNKKRKAKSSSRDPESAPAQRTRHEAGERGKAKTSSRPNLFIALQISNPDIHRRVDQFQQHVVSSNPMLSEACVPVAKSHITLHVLNAEESRLGVLEGALGRAGAAATGGRPLQLRLRGVSNFRDKVIFADIEANATLNALWSEISKELEALDLLPEVKPLAAHMTLLKTSRAKSKQVLKARIPASAYAELEDLDFGVQTCTSLQLLSMVRPQGRDGYYFKHAEVPFAFIQASRDRDEHSLCSQLKNYLPSKQQMKENEPNSVTAGITDARQVSQSVREAVTSNVTIRSDDPSNASNPYVVLALCGLTAIAAIKIFYAYRK